jgi:2-amino-4-hydroxy-6-hydroxymethyldihydropteridine diphosphokinase
LHCNDVVVIALGSNLRGKFKSSQDLLDAAVERLSSAGLRLRSRSRWWRSKSWPDPLQPPYINGIALVEPDHDPVRMLEKLQGIENEFGRLRGGVGHPRTLDLDIIAHGQIISADETLILPHPRAHLRRFVMGPLAELAPGWRHPVLNLSADELVWGTHIGNDALPIEYRDDASLAWQQAD